MGSQGPFRELWEQATMNRLAREDRMSGAKNQEEGRPSRHRDRTQHKSCHESGVSPPGGRPEGPPSVTEFYVSRPGARTGGPEKPAGTPARGPDEQRFLTDAARCLARRGQPFFRLLR